MLTLKTLVAVLAISGIGFAVPQEKPPGSARKVIAEIDLIDPEAKQVRDKGCGKIVDGPDGKKCYEASLSYGQEGIMSAAFIPLLLPEGKKYTVGPRLYLDFDVYYEGAQDPALWFSAGGTIGKAFHIAVLKVGNVQSGKWQTRTVNICSVTLETFSGMDKQRPNDGESFDEIAFYADRGLSRGIRRLLVRNFRFYEEDKLAGNADLNFKDPTGLTRLHRSVIEGNLKEVKSLLAQGADPNARNQEQETPLHLAAKAGAVEIAEVLIGAKAEVDAAAQAGWTPLQRASHKGQAAMVKLLIGKGAKMNVVLPHTDITPFYWAIVMAYKPTVEAFMDCGVDLEAETGGWRPLLLAVQDFFDHDPKREIVKLLIARGARQDIFSASAVGDVLVLEKLIKADPNVANAKIKGGYTPLHMAARKFNVEAVKLLLAHKADPSSATGGGLGNRTPLHLMMVPPKSKDQADRQLETVRLLVDAGSNLAALSIDGHSALFEAREAGIKPVVDFLVKRRALDK